MIQVDKLAKSFADLEVLKEVSFSIKAGERVSLSGPGSSGKTTLLKLILGLFTPNKGSARLLGEELARVKADKRESVLKQVGMAFQQGGLFDFLTVEENLRFALENMLPEHQQTVYQERIDQLLAAVKLPDSHKKYPHELSGGMKRRIGVARALITTPKLALFDEPTAGLDPVTSTIIIKMIRDIVGSSSSKSLLVSTSNIETAIRFADRIILLKDGKIAADGPWRQLLVEADPWVQNFLGSRLRGISRAYAKELDLPAQFIDQYVP